MRGVKKAGPPDHAAWMGTESSLSPRTLMRPAPTWNGLVGL